MYYYIIVCVVAGIPTASANQTLAQWYEHARHLLVKAQRSQSYTELRTALDVTESMGVAHLPVWKVLWRHHCLKAQIHKSVVHC